MRQKIFGSTKKIIPPLLALVFVALLLEFGIHKKWIPNYVIPAPTRLFEVFLSEGTLLFGALKNTALASLAGLSLSILIGFVMGTLFYLLPIVGAMFAPYTILFQTVPIVALAPLIVIWFGFGLQSVIASSFIVSLFPIVSGTLMGFRSVDKSLLHFFSGHPASAFKRLWNLLLPSSLPYFFESLRVSAGLSVIGAIVGEFMSGTGLGSVIEVSRVQFRVDLMFAAILLSAFYVTLRTY